MSDAIAFNAVSYVLAAACLVRGDAVVAEKRAVIPCESVFVL